MNLKVRPFFQRLDEDAPPHQHGIRFRRPTSANPLPNPIDFIRLSLDDQISVKITGNRQLYGKLHAYDWKLNMILGGVVELITTTEISHDTSEEISATRSRRFPFLYVRGDDVILVQTSLRYTTYSF